MSTTFLPDAVLRIDANPVKRSASGRRCVPRVSPCSPCVSTPNFLSDVLGPDGTEMSSVDGEIVQVNKDLL